MDGSEVDFVGLQLEEWHTLVAEFMVAGQSALSQLGGWDGIAKSNLSYGCKYSRGADSIAGSIEQRGYGANSFGCLSCCGGCACVVLDTAADCDVLELEARADRWEA